MRILYLDNLLTLLMFKQPQYRKHEGKTIARVDGYSVIDCLHCKFKHVWPFPTPEALSALYQQSYYTDVYPLAAEISESEIESSRRDCRKRLDDLESRIPVGRRKLLDVGAGNFGFLYVARERGWDVVGIEPSEQGKSRAQALNIPFIYGTFSPEAIAGRGPFDLIHLNCVLEHLLDPITLVQASYESLAPGGILSVCVPNDFNPLQHAFVESQDANPWWVSPLQHINYFNTKTLPRMLESMGFEIEDSEVTFPIEFFLLFGDDYVNNPSLGSDCHQKISRFEENMKKTGQAELLKQMYASFEQLGIGRRLLLTARKPQY